MRRTAKSGRRHSIHEHVCSRLRAGELQRLRDLKRKARNDQRKRKVLRRDQHFDTISDSADDAMRNLGVMLCSFTC